MPLTALTFARLKAGREISHSSDAAHRQERRRATRVPIGLRAQARVGGGGAWRTVLVRDVSIDGVGLQTDEPLPAGQLLAVRLDGAGGGTIELPCVVRWCETGGFLGSAHHVGAAWLEPPPDRGPGPDRPRWIDAWIVDRQRRLAMRAK